MAWFDIERQLAPLLRSGDLDSCIDRVSKELGRLSPSPFHIASALQFTNSPRDVAKYFERFISRESRNFAIGAVYTETNGFTINPDRWFFDAFAYKTYGGFDNLDWISDWQSGSFPDMTLTGMETLQKAYETEFIDNPRNDEAGYASLLVVFKFQKLIKVSAPLITNLSCPLLATAHDYDLVYEFRKNA